MREPARRIDPSTESASNFTRPGPEMASSTVLVAAIAGTLLSSLAVTPGVSSALIAACWASKRFWAGSMKTFWYPKTKATISAIAIRKLR